MKFLSMSIEHLTKRLRNWEGHVGLDNSIENNGYDENAWLEELNNDILLDPTDATTEGCTTKVKQKKSKAKIAMSQDKKLILEEVENMQQ